MTKTKISIAMVLAAIVGVGCDSDEVTDPDNGPEETTACTSSATNACMVTMTGSNTFTPGTIRVTEGSTVTWHNDASFAHTSTGATWDSGPVSSGGEFEQAFPSAGTFTYVCTIHSGMQGTVVVE